MNHDRKYWIGVASRDHVMRGINEGICQFCHGKRSPAQRLKKDDYIIYYSPRIAFNGTEPCQKFTAIGIVADEQPYQVNLSPEFKPFRRRVHYLHATEIDIKPLIHDLLFINNKQAWGATFRFGFLQIDELSFKIIYGRMMEPNCETLNL